MKKSLPARPNLEHLRTQAKTLFSKLTSGDREAAGVFIEHLPAARRMTADQVLKAKFKLADAQSVVARKSGFSSWPTMVRHVEQLRQMEGSWQFVDMEVDGRPYPAAMFANSRMLIDGDRFRMESPEATYEGIFTIDVESVPHHLDIEFVEGPEAGNWSYGIFEVEGDRFKICLGLVGAGRPSQFVTTPQSGHALENLRRVSKVRPENVKGGTPGSPEETVAAGPVAFDDEITPLLLRLAGEWIPLQLIQNGQALQEAYLPFGSRSFSGNETKVVFGGQTMVHAKVRLDDTQTPIAVDYLSLLKSSSGQISRGVMQWIGDEIEFCMSPAGKPRPADFSCEPGSGRTLSRWKRK